MKMASVLSFDAVFVASSVSQFVAGSSSWSVGMTEFWLGSGVGLAGSFSEEQIVKGESFGHSTHSM